MLRWLLVAAMVGLLALHFARQVDELYREDTATSLGRAPRGLPPPLSVCLMSNTSTEPLAAALPGKPAPHYNRPPYGPFHVPLELWQHFNWSAGPLERLWELAAPPLHQLVLDCNDGDCRPTADSADTPSGTWERQLMNDGVCYTLRANRSLNYQPRAYKLVEEGPLLRINSSTAGAVWIGLPGNETLPRDGMFEPPIHAYPLEPGYAYDIRLSETRNELANTRRSPCRPGNYHQLWCRAQCAWRAVTAAAGCRLPWMVLPEDVPPCTDYTSMARAVRALTAGPTARSCRAPCPPACSFSEYQTSKKSGPFLGAGGTSGVRLVWDQTARVQTERLALSWEGLLADMAGLVGLTLGVSLTQPVRWYDVRTPPARGHRQSRCRYSHHRSATGRTQDRYNRTGQAHLPLERNAAEAVALGLDDSGRRMAGDGSRGGVRRRCQGRQ